MTPDEIIRSKRKSLSIEVRPGGRLVVRAPYFLNNASIDAFIRQKEGWILRKRAELAAASPPAPFCAADGARLPYLGGERLIRIGDFARAELVGDELHIPRQAGAGKLAAWLKREARRVISGRLEVLSREAGAEYSALKITGARTRWGSCGGKNGLNFSWRLIVCPPALIDYVIVHELCHIAHKNHGQRFWAAVEKLMPDWRARRAALKKYAAVADLLPE